MRCQVSGQPDNEGAVSSALSQSGGFPPVWRGKRSFPVLVHERVALALLVRKKNSGKNPQKNKNYLDVAKDCCIFKSRITAA